MPNLTVCCIDNFGIGQSPQPTERTQYSIAENANDILDVMNALSWSQAHIVGHSMGTMISMQFASTHPDKVRSLALLSCSPRRTLTDKTPGQGERAKVRV